MKTFDYKTEMKSCSRDFVRNSIAETDYLCFKGTEGWELVSVVSYDPTTNMDRTIYYWKREKNN